jgi:O-antigen/teichoic acid export membrane protein
LTLISNYLQNFLSRAGSYVFTATLASRGLSFLASWIALQLIDHKELGIVLFAYNFIFFLIPISGFGLHQSLIRYGALLETKEEKDNLFLYVTKKGLFATIILIILIILGSFLIDFQFKNTQLYVIILSFVLIPTYLFEVIRAQFRLKHDNKSFAYTEFFMSFFLVISVFVLSYFFQEIGYAIAMIIAPLCTSLFFIKKLNIQFSSTKKTDIIDFTFWKYGFFASLSNVVTQLLFVIDILLIGYLLKDTEMITNYRYVSLIPFSLLFLPRVFMATDFVVFTENIFDKKYIINYMKSYMYFFLIISFLLLLVSFLFADFILGLLDPNFVQFSDTFLILMLGIVGIYIFRGLYGNLLSSIGKAHINYYIATIALILNVITNYFLIPEYGIKGAAITTAILMWVTGIVSMVVFWYIYSKVLVTKEYVSTSAPKLL